MLFCNDSDLLHWEPSLFRDAAAAAQTLLAGIGDLAGTQFTIASGSFIDEGVLAGHVICLEGALAGCYPIASVDSATQLALSVLCEALHPELGAGQPSPIGNASGVSYAVRTFWPQRKVVSELIQRCAGVGAETPLPDATILNAAALKRSCALGTLQMIYSALAAAAPDPSVLSLRAEMYERLYRRSLSAARVEIDVDGDGKGEIVRALNVIELVRM